MENLEQRQAIQAALDGESIFITGPGGTGKSFILDILCSKYKSLGKEIAVTALTGCAALLLGSHAKTLHSWAGIGLGNGDVSSIIRSIAMNGRKKKNWKKTDCLVIDEVSMLTPQLLSLLDKVGKTIRKCHDKPLGGIQIIFVGDFYQLPPIVKGEISFAFQSPIWTDIVSKTICLTKIYRQSDETFQTILNEARVGALSQSSIDILTARKTNTWKSQKIRPTLLFTRNDDVNIINTTQLARINSELKTFKVVSVNPVELKKGTLDAFLKKDETDMTVAEPTSDIMLQQRIDRLDKDAPYESVLNLKVGAQVMLITNLDQEGGLINGSRGVVADFDKDGFPLVEFKSHSSRPIRIKPHVWKSEGDSIIHRQQIPLRLAYAVTIHKAQGASLDSALVDIGRSTFEYGQAYVALSRVRSLDALFVYDFDPGAFRVHPIVKSFYQSQIAAEETKIAAATHISES